MLGSSGIGQSHWGLDSAEFYTCGRTTVSYNQELELPVVLG
jgi:hypothetical protein